MTSFVPKHGGPDPWGQPPRGAAYSRDPRYSVSSRRTGGPEDLRSQVCVYFVFVLGNGGECGGGGVCVCVCVCVGGGTMILNQEKKNSASSSNWVQMLRLLVSIPIHACVTANQLIGCWLSHSGYSGHSDIKYWTWGPRVKGYEVIEMINYFNLDLQEVMDTRWCSLIKNSRYTCRHHKTCTP